MRFSFQKIILLAGFACCLYYPHSAFSQVKKSAAVSQFRSITVITEPGAIVWLDGVRFGKTGAAGTLELKSVPPGIHTVRVRADGFREKSQTLAAAQKGDMSIPLVKTNDEAELAYQEAERLTGDDRERVIQHVYQKWGRPDREEMIYSDIIETAETDSDFQQSLSPLSHA